MGRSSSPGLPRLRRMIDRIAEDPRFVCRRVGHYPAMRLTSGGEWIESYICPCARCGKLAEWDRDGNEIKREQAAS